MENTTVGPWYESHSSEYQGLVISEPTGANVAVTYSKADAKLVAAAPELLEALEEICDLPADADSGERIIPAGFLNAARAAIAKARGAALITMAVILTSIAAAGCKSTVQFTLHHDTPYGTAAASYVASN